MEKLIADNKKNINIFETMIPILIFIASLSLVVQKNCYRLGYI